MDGDKPLPLTEFDRVTVSESTQVIKAVIPFLDTSNRKTISIFIRFQELMQTIDFFNKPLHTENLSSFNRENYTMKDILSETMPYFSKSTGDTVSMIQNLMDMLNVFNLYKDMGQNDQSQDFQSIINMVSNMNNNSDISDVFKNMTMNPGSNSNTSDSTINKSDSNSNNSDSNLNNDSIFNNSDSNSSLNDIIDNFNTDNTSNNIETNDNSDTAGKLNNMMNEDQKKLYEKYLKEIETINF